MNFTSSSECDCAGPFSFSTTIPNIIGNPFCPTTRQPLIYYARIQEPFDKHQNKGNIKDNSNCFMRAFQWYTQERESGHKNEIDNSKANHSDFAAWLDKKYNEYLRRSQQNGSQLILKHSPTLEGDKISKKDKSSRKFGRMRSPWRRRRRTNSKEKSDVQQIKQSIEYILQPQDLPKPASECGERNSRIQSSTTIISKESPKYTKVKVKSKSLLSIYRAPGDCDNKEVNTKSHAKNICECLKTDKGTQYETLSLESLTTSRNYNTGPPFEGTTIGDVTIKRYSPQRFPGSNVLCQCSEVNPYKYPSRQEGYSNEKHKSNWTNQAHSPKMNKTGVMFTENDNRNKITSRDCIAQTSDHSIHFENGMYEPLLLKIIHVNK